MNYNQSFRSLPYAIYTSAHGLGSSKRYDGKKDFEIQQHETEQWKLGSLGLALNNVKGEKCKDLWG